MRYDVVVVGDLFYDVMTYPIDDYPEKDTQKSCKFMTGLGGQAGNCAAACASLGLKTAIICKVGRDKLSKLLLSELEDLGVRCFSSFSEHDLPGVTVSITFKDGSRTMLSHRGANLELKIDDIDKNVLKSAGFLMRAGHWNTEGLLDGNIKIFETVSSAKIPIGLDIGWSAYLGWTEEAIKSVMDLLPYTDFLFINEREIEALTSKKGTRKLLEKGCRNVIIHRGKEGSAWVTEEKRVEVGAFEVGVKRPTGAGDVFNAGFIYAFLSGMDEIDCLRFANACSALYIGRAEGYPTIREVVDFLEVVKR